ncbi:nucleotide-binding alpha-beta plait domain-containing protein [Tanacetum coccineum]
MGSHRSKEDEVQKISSSVFITKFSDSFSARDLFKSCSIYGNVVDAYIPNKRSKAEKRFGFVRFIKVFNMERLVNNLCTMWVGRYRLHANTVRFERTSLNNDKNQTKKKYEENISYTRDNNNDNGVKGLVKSYVHVVKGRTPSVNVEAVSSPTMVLEDDCLNQQDLAHSLMGRVKELASLSNLKKVLANEGFDNIEIEYLGELWALLKFASEESKNLFQENAGVGTWFSQLQQASIDFIVDGRITWVKIEGIPLINDNYESIGISKEEKVQRRLHGLEEDVLFWNDSDVEGVSETKFEAGSHNSNKEDVFGGQMDSPSDDPFKIYELLNKENEDINKGPSHDSSLKYPPGFTPSVDMEET